MTTAPHWVEDYFAPPGPALKNEGTGSLHNVATTEDKRRFGRIRFLGVAPTVTGFADGTPGRRLSVYAIGGPLVLANEDSGSLSFNRIVTGTGSDLTIAEGASGNLEYDEESARWRVIGGTGGGGGGGATLPIDLTTDVTGPLPAANRGAPAGVTYPELHGATGDGVADDDAEIDDVATDFNAASTDDVALELGARTYLVTGLDPWPFGLSVFGQGPKSILKSTTDAPILNVNDNDAGDRAKATTLANFAVLGSGKASGKTSQDGVRSGYDGTDGSSRTFIFGVYAKDIGGSAFLNLYTDAIGTGGVTAFCRAESCREGFVLQEGESFSPQAINCTTGARIAGGNHVMIGGSFEGCTTAYQLQAGGNDAHGSLIGTSFVHNTTALDYAATANGQYAIGIRVFDGIVSIANGNSKFHTFVGSTIAPTQFNVLGKARWIGCTFGTAYYTSSDFSGGENEFIDPRGEDGKIPYWIGEQYHATVNFPDSSDITLSSQKGWAPVIEVTGEPGVDVNLLSTREPSRGERQWIVNRMATEAVNYFWATGDGIEIPAQKSALIGFEDSEEPEVMICYALTDNVANSVARPATGIASLPLTAWLRPSYSGSPWNGTASAGVSGDGSHDATEGTNPPATGGAVNGFTPADFDGVNDKLTLDGTTFDDYFNAASYSFAALVYVDASPYDFDDTTPYENAAIVCSAPNAYVGAFVRSSGVVQWNHLTAAPVRTVISTSLTLGSWQLAQARFGGGTLELRVNGGAWVSASGLGNLDIVAQVLRLGVNYGATAYLDGKYLDVLTSDQKLNDTQFDLIRSELGTRYGLTL